MGTRPASGGPVTAQVARLLVVRMETSTRFPLSAGILFGLGLGGFFDGIVLHQVLQWHHMLTNAGVPADTVQNMRINVFWDGIFHLATYAFVAAGLAVLWLWWHADPASHSAAADISGRNALQSANPAASDTRES